MVVPFNELRLVLIINEKTSKITLLFFHQGRFDESNIPKKTLLNALAKTGRKEEFTIEIINESNRRESMLNCLNKAVKATEDQSGKNQAYCVYGYYIMKEFFDDLAGHKPVFFFMKTDYTAYRKEASSINWYFKAVEHVSTVISEMDVLIEERLDVSRQLNIPLCNLPESWEIYATDIL